MQLIRTLWFPHRIYLLHSGLGSTLKDFQPDLIHWVGPTSYFGYSVPQYARSGKVPVVSFFSECLGWHPFDWRAPGIGWKSRVVTLAYHYLRGPMVRAACRCSTLIVGLTPQTNGILLGLFRGRAERHRQMEKMITLPLGFDPQVTKWDPAGRKAVRDELGFEADDVVVCVSSNFRSGKVPRLTMVINGVHGAMRQTARLKALVVGMSQGRTTEVIRNMIETGPFPGRFICHEFADQDRLNALYNAADIALFNNASNSCQAALGTGLLACFGDNDSMNHLLSKADQGFFYLQDDPEDMAAKLAAAAEVIAPHLRKGYNHFRQHLAEESRWLGYDRIIGALMHRVEDKIAAQAGNSKQAEREE